MTRNISWAYGVMTVPARMETLLPITLNSLCCGGFTRPRLFVDGSKDRNVWAERFQDHPITLRYPALGTAGNWVLTLYELYIREPTADLYAIFQDDFVTYMNLRSYLEACVYPDGVHSNPHSILSPDELLPIVQSRAHIQVSPLPKIIPPKGYWNLYTFPENEVLAPKDTRGQPRIGWYLSNQFGRGAVATVFSREAVVILLSHSHMIRRHQSPKRGKCAIDGGIVTAMNQAGWREYTHYPSLVQHTGIASSMGNLPHPLAASFRGEAYNAMDLLAERDTIKV